MMSIGGDAGVEKQSSRVLPDDINTFIAECGHHYLGEVMPAHICEPDTLVPDSSFAPLIDRKWRVTP